MRLRMCVFCVTVHNMCTELCSAQHQHADSFRLTGSEVCLTGLMEGRVSGQERGIFREDIGLVLQKEYNVM